MATRQRPMKAMPNPATATAGVMNGQGTSGRGTSGRGKTAATVPASATVTTAGGMTGLGKIARLGTIGPVMSGPVMSGPVTKDPETTGQGTTGPGTNVPETTDLGMSAPVRIARPGKTGRGGIARKAVAGIAGASGNPVRIGPSAIPWP